MGASSYLQGDWNCFVQVGFGKPGLISWANTGPAPAQPCSGRTGVSKAVAPHLGPHPGEADFTGGNPSNWPSPRQRGPWPGGHRLSSAWRLTWQGPAQPPPSQALRTRVGAGRKRPAPLPARPCEAPRACGLGWVSEQLLPALSFSFTLVLTPK